MRVVCLFSDTEQMLEHRKQYGQQHLDYLRKHRTEILIGGGLRDEQDSPFVGGLWIMEVSNLERAKELVENDPYFAPDYRTYSLKVWGKALDEAVTL